MILSTGITMITETMNFMKRLLPHLCTGISYRKKDWALFRIILFKFIFRFAFSIFYFELYLEKSKLFSFPLSGKWWCGIIIQRTTNWNAKSFVLSLSFIEQNKIQPYIKPIWIIRLPEANFLLFLSLSWFVFLYNEHACFKGYLRTKRIIFFPLFFHLDHLHFPVSLFSE